MDGNIIVFGAGADTPARVTDRKDRQAISKICPPFAGCITEINNTQVGNKKDLDVAMPMYNLIEYGDNYSNSLLQR